MKRLELRVVEGTVYLFETEQIAEGFRFTDTGRKAKAYEIDTFKPTGELGPKGKAFPGATFPGFFDAKQRASDAGKKSMAKLRASLVASGNAEPVKVLPAKLPKTRALALPLALAALGVTEAEFLTDYVWDGSTFVIGADDPRFRREPLGGWGWASNAGPVVADDKSDAYIEKLRAESMADALASGGDWLNGAPLGDDPNDPNVEEFDGEDSPY